MILLKMINNNPNLYPAPAKMNSDKFSKQVTIAAGSEEFVGFNVKTKANVLVKGIGYTWYTSNEFRIVTGNRQFPKRTDQLGSASIPHIWDNPYPAKQGDNVGVYIKNGDAVDHTYDVVIYYMSDVELGLESTGGELVIATGGGSSVANNVVLYNSALTTAANVTSLGLAVNPSIPSTLVSGQNTGITTTGAAIGASTSLNRGVVVQAASTNTEIVYIGNSSGQFIELDAGDSVPIEIDNLSKIYAKSASGTQTINYMGS